MIAESADADSENNDEVKWYVNIKQICSCHFFEKCEHNICHFCRYQIGRGIKFDLLGRLPFYWDDFKDGIVGPNTIQKVWVTCGSLYILGCLIFRETNAQFKYERPESLKIEICTYIVVCTITYMW